MKRCFLILLLLTGCGSLSSNVVLDTSHSEDKATLSELANDLAQPLIAGGHNSGIVIGIQDARGLRHVFGYGHGIDGSDRAPDGQTVFAIGSLTKSFTALLYEELVREGQLKPSDTVGDILPEASSFSPAARAITLRQLVEHSSGMPRQPNDLAMLEGLIDYSFTGDDIYAHIDRACLDDYLTHFDPSAEDTGHYRYSNIGMGLLGLLIETKMQASLEDLMQSRVIAPMKLHDTTYHLTAAQEARLATGHAGDSPFLLPRGTPIAPWQMTNVFKGAAGLYATADDLLIFLGHRLTQQEESFVLPLAGREGVMEQVPGEEVDRFPQGTIIYQHGMISGYAAYMGYAPAQKVAVVVLYNDFDWDDKIGHNLVLALMRDAAMPPGERLDPDK